MGKKNRLPDRRGAASRKGAWQRDLSPDVRNLIKNRTVDVSTAHTYYIKLWNAVLPRLLTVV